jgi:hypothetical protein
MVKVTQSTSRNAVIGITIDKYKLKSEANRLLNASAVWLSVKQLAKFNWNDIPTFWRNIVAVFNTVMASLEVARAELLKGQPEGTLISGAMLAQAAVEIIDDAITFTGVIGKLVEAVDGPVLRLLINVVLGDRHGVNWIEEAWGILGLNQTA